MGAIELPFAQTILFDIKIILVSDVRGYGPDDSVWKVSALIVAGH